MEANQAIQSLPSPRTFPEERIPPSQVWIHLTPDQQHCLLQAIVLVCRELVLTWSRSLESEVSDE